MKFTVTFEISPSAPFGVPEEGMTVLPGAPGTHTHTGDTYHTTTMTRVGYGSLSEYRKESDAIRLRLQLGRVEGRIQDNFAFLQVDANDHIEAFSATSGAIDTFLQHLAVSQKRVFTPKALIKESEDGRVYPVPKMVKIASVTTYALDNLRKDIQDAQQFFSIEDERLQRAMKYFEHSLLLYNKRSEIADALSRHNDYLIASVFLNLWKAVSTIVGDPSRRKDSYQKRYRMIGLDSTYKPKIDRLKEFRDDYDVAHYSLSDDSLKEVEKSYGEAVNIASDILQQYREYLCSVTKPGV